MEKRVKRGISLSVILAALVATSAAAQMTDRAVGQKLADGEAYVTLVQLSHQPKAADNGRILISFEIPAMDGIPIYESRDEGASWKFVTFATDPHQKDHAKCNLHWQPHLMEMPRTVGALKAGTVLLSASSVCNDANGRMASMQLQLYGSRDQGRAWKYIGAVADGTVALPVWEPHLVLLDDGKLVTYYSSETHKADGYNQLLSHKVSRDGGKSWGPEVYDTAIAGGVERPGMVIIARLPDGSYVYNHEDVQGPNSGQVHIKFSKDGLSWGPPEARGTPVQALGGEYPTSCPVIGWYPVGGPDGVLIVSASGAGGGGNPAGRSLYWNNNRGIGPWWEVPAPVQKLMNGRAGWTQALMLKRDGSFLHITSSASPEKPMDPTKNEILFASGRLDFNRYEAEDAARTGSAMMNDPSMSNGRKVRLGAKDVGRLKFLIHVADGGAHRLSVNYGDIGFAATPRLIVNGTPVSGTAAPAPLDSALAARQARDLGTRGSGKRTMLSATADLKAGDNDVEILGGDYALDVDYLEVTPAH